MNPVVDISEHQGAVNFATMKAKGVRALIIRVAHGQTLDIRFDQNYTTARAAGYEHHEIAAYSFINPKRGSAIATAQFAADNCKRVMGQDPIMYMADIENYRDQSPNVGSQPLRGQPFAVYIEDHLDFFGALCQKTYKTGYSNRSYYNGVDGPNDIELAQSLEWIVARYPVYSAKGYQLYPVPGVDLWEQYAFTHAPDGPYPPIGALGWGAWQFSAGFNKQGAPYGAQSSDLDLNIFEPAFYGRCFGADAPVPPQPTEDTMNYYVVAGSNARFFGWGPMVWWTGPGSDKLTAAINTQLAANNLTQVDLTGGPNAFSASTLNGPLPTGDTLHTWTGAEFAALLPANTGVGFDQVARDAAKHANDGVDNINKRIVEAKELGVAAWQSLA